MKYIANYNFSMLISAFNWGALIFSFYMVGEGKVINRGLNNLLSYYTFLSFIPAVISLFIAIMLFHNKSIGLKKFLGNMGINIPFLLLYIAFIAFAYIGSRYYR